MIPFISCPKKTGRFYLSRRCGGRGRTNLSWEKRDCHGLEVDACVLGTVIKWGRACGNFLE